MSKLGRNPVEDLIIGNAVASETTTATFIASASDKEIKVLSADGTAPAAGKEFKVYQKTAGDAAKNLGYEYSGSITPSNVEAVIVKEFSPEVQKEVTVAGFSTANKADSTYVVEVRLFTDGGDLSPENFTIVSGYYVTGVTVPTGTTVRDGLIASLNANLKLRGNSELVVAVVDANSFTITGKYQDVIPGRVIGKQVDFQVAAKVFDNTALIDENLGTLTSTVTQVANSGSGTGKYAVNHEWFIKGFKYEVFREVSYPHNFNTPYYADKAADYNAIHVRYFDERESPGIEKQSKTLTILVERANLAGNAVTNAVLADLRTVLGSANVPANLATS